MKAIFSAIVDRIFGKRIKVFCMRDVPRNYGTYGGFGKKST